MADQKPSHKFITPRGVAVYPKLNKPDTKFNEDGEYRAKILVPATEIPAELHANLTALRDDLADETRDALVAKKSAAKAKSIKVLDIFRDELDKETGEPTGNVAISAKMRASGVSKKDGKPWTRAPKLFDAKGGKFPLSKIIWGGSELKLAVEARAYYMPKDNEVGVAFYLEAVQVLKLVSGNDKDAKGYGFGEEEGYEAEEAEAPPFDGDSAAASEKATASAGDDF